MTFTKQIELAGESVTELMNIAKSLSEENSTQYNKLKQLRELIAVRNTEVNKLTISVASVGRCNDRQCETIIKKRKENETLMIINANVTSDNQSLRDMNRNQFALLEANRVDDQPEITHLTEVIDDLNSVNADLDGALIFANAKINTQFAELFEANDKINTQSAKLFEANDKLKRLSGLYNQNQTVLRESQVDYKILALDYDNLRDNKQFPIKRIKELEGQISVLQGTNVKLIKEQAKVKAFFEGL